MKTKYFVAVLFALICLKANAQKKNIKTESFVVYGNCSLCKQRIESALKNFGTYKSSWDIDSKLLTVIFDSLKLSKTKIQKQLALEGHDTEAFQTDDSTYNSLPECCYYARHQKLKKPLFVEDTTKIVVDSFSKTKSIKLDSIKNISSNDSNKILNKSATTTLINVTVASKKFSTFVASANEFNTLYISARELSKAACCNLSESFETSPSVDVSYADAVTGMKQIQLLGLSGKYIQITTENVPEIRGLCGNFGLTFIPGTWIQSIQVTKGSGSVVNGYESIAGQINIEEKKTKTAEKLFANVYANQLGRLETSFNFSKKINNNWSTDLLTHANQTNTKTDDNKDGFLDIPLGKQFNVTNRWAYENEKGLVLQLILKALNDNRQAGQTDFNPLTDKLTRIKYGIGIDVQQYSITGKLGYVFPHSLYKSIGIIFSATNFNNNSYYGLNNYNGKQNSIYANLIYQSIIGSVVHKFRAGLNFVSDVYTENFNANNFQRNEITTGLFFEYTYTPSVKFSAVAGLRSDYHNEYNLFSTPRLNLKYNFNPRTNLRFSIGSGLRTANIFAENTGLFISSRQYIILNPTSNYGYGLSPEKAWNYGLNFTHQFRIKSQPTTLSIDAYYTNFTNQVVVDIDKTANNIFFSNLNGRSFSNTLQVELNYEPIENLEIRLAYKYLDVQTNYNGLMLEKPFTAKHRAFINLAFETSNRWKFDYTTQWFSQKRLPNTSNNPIDKQMENYSPAFIQMSSQITKQFGSKWDVYIGAENLTNFTQDNLIISANEPFGPYFDASIIWGNVNGRIVYVGARFKIANQKN